ncbi:Acg family FMN-binding oxidoreductase [Actinoplanes sp. NPDC026623]|uniref:Acg family FMN-binding oxidoreductase n=1 Tax=Actinoplanes sp. NPDC026623 TaxID=3155610 RepID=UPI0033C5B1D0
MSITRTDAPGGRAALPALSRAVLTDCVRTATAAPSLHNSQPWRFRITGDGVDVYTDSGRRLDVLDPAGRELLISVGAALFTLRLAIRRKGFRPVFALFPDAEDAGLVARVAVGPPAAATPAVEALAAAVAHRHTNRWPFAQTAVPGVALSHLRDAARREGAVLAVAGPTARDAIVRLSQVANRRLQTRAGYRAERSRWTVPRRRDGVPRSAVGPWDALETVPVRDFGLLPPHAATGAFEPYPTLLVLATEGDGRTQWVTAGQALQRVLLTATWQNLATTPISQPIEVPAIRRLLSAAAEGRWAQMIIRIGYGRQVVATPRRRLSEVLVQP